MKWNRNNTIVGTACLLKIALHLIADFNSGFQGDELLHINAGKHLAFGYMEFPPLIALLAYLQNLSGSSSVFVHHFFSHIASLIIMVLAAKITIELGGKTKALVLVMIAILAAPAFTRTHQLFQPVVFSQFFWLLAFLLFARFVYTLKSERLLLLTIILAAGFLNKYDIIFFMTGMISLFFTKRTRSEILRPKHIILPFLFILLISPNIFWQIHNGFPVIQHMNELYKAQLNNQTAFKILIDLFVQLNPIAVFIYAAGLYYAIFILKDEKHRVLSASILISILVLAVAKGKAYYFFPAIIFLIIMGSIWLEDRVFNKRQWLYYTQIVLLVISGAFMLPYGMPVLKLERFIAYAQIEEEKNRYPLAFEEFYSHYQWKEVLSSLKATYECLDQEEKKNCIIWGKHYKQAGAVNLFSKEHGIPKAISYHGSFYTWAPAYGPMPNTVITISNKGVPKTYWEYFFSVVELADVVKNRYADEEEDVLTSIYICREPKKDYLESKETFRNRIFE